MTALKELLRDGNFIYQPMKHHCGYKGNSYHKVDGVWKKRTHCPQCNESLTWIPIGLSCSPFGCHNTVDLTKDGSRLTKIPRPCSLCGKVGIRRGGMCWMCRIRRKRKHNFDKLYTALGGMRCWICGYGRCRQAMDFHHVDASNKFMNLSSREMQMRWETIWTEAQKCVLLCACCHREIHAGLITKEEVNKIYEEKWNYLGTYLKGRGSDS